MERSPLAFLFVLCLVSVAGCGSSTPSAPGGGGSGSDAPAASSPADAAQLSSLRPALVVSNSRGSGSGRTYEFQVSDRSDFASPASMSPAGYALSIVKTGVAEGSGGTTSYVPDVDLQPATKMYWRVRAVQGTAPSDWSATRTFDTEIVGYNRPGELYDPLFGGGTIGTRIGSTTFVPGKGLRVETQDSYVRYQLLQTISNGEMSVEVEGIYGNGPGAKLKIFSMFNGTGNHYDSKYLFNVQYRGLDGNPNNAFSFKALFGDSDWKYEPNFGQRAASAMMLSPARTYFWKATWGNEVRVMVQDGRGGPTIYNLGIPATEGTYAPSPHYAYLGVNGPSSYETGSWPGAIYRNLWIGAGQRPASLGSAVD
jgi:hypothetical protein